jgi:hypothetical protein
MIEYQQVKRKDCQCAIYDKGDLKKTKPAKGGGKTEI